jgi:hypothetical protein
MTEQKILTYSKESGWVTKMIYRKSVDDFVITQKNKKINDYRTIYLFGDGVTDKIMKFMKEVEKLRVKR